MLCFKAAAKLITSIWPITTQRWTTLVYGIKKLPGALVCPVPAVGFVQTSLYVSESEGISTTISCTLCFNQASVIKYWYCWLVTRACTRSLDKTKQGEAESSWTVRVKKKKDSTEVRLFKESRSPWSSNPEIIRCSDLRLTALNKY